MQIFHKAHLVDPSPWPILASMNLLLITTGGVGYLHGYESGKSILELGLVSLGIILFCWWRDIIREGFHGHHSPLVEKNLRLGMILFIVSEVMFFFAFFWGFFHSSLAPTHLIGCVWPPANIDILSPFAVPFLNTALLLTSGAWITVAHNQIVIGPVEGLLIFLYGREKERHNKETVFPFVCTLLCGIIFLLVQFFEYAVAPFSIGDSIYGSTFYIITGFHGIHVMIGTIFIWVSARRYTLGHFTKENHFGFEASAWYWHFVDVVWLFVYIFIYYWAYDKFYIFL